MVVADLLKIGGELLKMLSKYDVKTNDYRFADLYFEYEQRRKDNEKYMCIVDELANKYKVSPSTVERYIRKFRKAVKL